MTGYTVHTGSNEQFSSNWDRIFGGGAKKPSQPKKTAAETPAEKQPAAKPAAKSASPRGKRS